MAAVKKKRSWFTYIFIIVIAAASVALYGAFAPNTATFKHGPYLYIHTGDDYAKVKTALEEGNFLSSTLTFDMVAKAGGLATHIHPGKYKIDTGMSNYSIVRMLHAGKQVQVKVTINKLRTKQDLVNLLSGSLEADSLKLKALLNDNEYLSKFGLDSNTAMCAMMPNTYFFKWNTPADKAFAKIADSYLKFWDAEHIKDANAQGLTPAKVMIIASIVDEETILTEDKGKIASVYMNRLKKGMKLQADPTVKFAVNDFTIKRIAGPMLQSQSPYNTYVHEGLPPGPICTPSPSSVQSVLMAPKTNYLYFCAKEDFSGYSAFASTYEEQQKNARAYQKALDARNIH